MGDEGKIALSSEENAMLREELKMLHDTLVKVADEKPKSSGRLGPGQQTPVRRSASRQRGTPGRTPVRGRSVGSSVRKGGASTGAAPGSTTSSVARRPVRYVNTGDVVEKGKQGHTEHGQVVSMCATIKGDIWCARSTQVITVYNQYKEERQKLVTPSLSEAVITLLTFLPGTHPLIAVCFSDGAVELLSPDGCIRVPRYKLHENRITAAAGLGVADQKLATASECEVCVSFPSKTEAGALKEHAKFATKSKVTYAAAGGENVFFLGTEAGTVSRCNDKKIVKSAEFRSAVLSIVHQAGAVWVGLGQGEGVVVADADTMVARKTYCGAHTTLLKGLGHAVWGVNQNGVVNVWTEGAITTIATTVPFVTGCATDDGEVWACGSEGELIRWRGEGYCKDKLSEMKKSTSDAGRKATMWEELHAKEVEKGRRLAEELQQAVHASSIAVRDSSILQTRLRRVETEYAGLRRELVECLNTTLEEQGGRQVTFPDGDLVRWVREMSQPHSLAYQAELVGERNRLQEVTRRLNDQLNEAIETHTKELKEQVVELSRENIKLVQVGDGLRGEVGEKVKDAARVDRERMEAEVERDRCRAEVAVVGAENSRLLARIAELEAAAVKAGENLAVVSDRASRAEATTTRLSAVSFERDNLASKVFTSLPLRKHSLLNPLTTFAHYRLLSSYFTRLRLHAAASLGKKDCKKLKADITSIEANAVHLDEEKRKLMMLIEKLKEAQKRSNTQLHIAAQELGELKNRP